MHTHAFRKTWFKKKKNMVEAKLILLPVYVPFSIYIENAFDNQREQRNLYGCKIFYTSLEMVWLISMNRL